VCSSDLLMVGTNYNEHTSGSNTTSSSYPLASRAKCAQGAPLFQYF
jgi:hypothetical protein